MAHMLMSKDTMMSVRETPWHGLGAVLDDYPQSIDEAIQKSGLGWRVKQGSILVTQREGEGDPFEALRIADRIAAQYEQGGLAQISAGNVEEYLAQRVNPAVISPADGFRANLREDDGAVLGIVSDDYKVVQNEDAFKFLDALIGSDLHFETAGSLMNGKRVWVLARLPEWIEVGGDETAMFVYVVNSHDGSMAVTSSATDVRIVCNNTLTWALNKSEARAERTYKFRHMGDLQIKFDEARRVMGMTLNYAEQFKKLGDRLAQVRVTKDKAADMAAELFPIAEDMGDRAKRNRVERTERVVDIFDGANDTQGNSPGTAWTYANAVAEFGDWERRYTKRTDQMQRSFEDTGGLKQKGLDQAVALLS
jgi:phage/plasmid-like protein (TIGR03299 family)